MTEHYFPLKIPINSNTTTSFSPQKQTRGTDGPVPAKWRHSGASCIWRHIFSILISVNLLWKVVYIYEFSLKSIKAMRFNSTFPRTFWSPLVGSFYFWRIRFSRLFRSKQLLLCHVELVTLPPYINIVLIFFTFWSFRNIILGYSWK